MQYRVFLLILLLFGLISPTKAQNEQVPNSITSVEQAIDVIVNQNKEIANKALNFLTANKADRKLIAQMKAIVNFNDESPIIRKSAYLLLANSDEPYVSKLLKRQVDNEEDKELKIMLNDSYHKILLDRKSVV